MSAVEAARRAAYAARRAERRVRSAKPTGILWEGLSPHDGSPLVMIATCDSKNPKTGPMVQTYIIRSDMDPRDAVRLRMDGACCGACPLRGKGCYVLLGQGPLIVWQTYQRGGYRRITPEALKGYPVRIGTYGDPAMVPPELIRQIVDAASHHTGYTHAWRQPYGAGLRGLVMASVETPAQQKRAQSQGWGTFRIGAGDMNDWADASVCNETATGQQCIACGRCDGRQEAIVVPAHGMHAKHTPAERRRRALAVLQA